MNDLNMRLIKSKIYEKNYTIKDIAEKIEMCPQTLSNWINDKNTHTIIKFSNLLYILDIEIKDLIIDEEKGNT